MQPDLGVGGRLADYRLDAVVGHGGMGVVYRAFDERLGRVVAVKVISTDLAEREMARRRFLRESRLAAALEHPHVVPLYEAGEDDGQLFLAMRYVDGGDLGAYLRERGPLSVPETVELLSGVADALDVTHVHGLIHRDVKPANILLGARPDPGCERHVYLADFGLTKNTASVSRGTGTGRLLGTMDYLAPEQIQGDPATPAVDRYALACVIVECLSGSPPFSRDLEAATLWAHLQEAPPSLAEVGLPAEVDAVIATALAKDPAQRYDSCCELLAALSAGAEGRLVDAEAARADEFVKPAPTRRRWRLAALVALVVVAVVLAGAIWLDRVTADGLRSEQLADGTATLVDTSTGELVTSFPVSGHPSTLIPAAGGGVWVADFDNGTVTRWDAEGRPVGLPIGTSGRPTSLAEGLGSLWVLQRLEGTLLRINITAHAVGDVIPLGVGLTDLAVDELTAKIWVANRLDGTLTAVDAATTKPIGEPVLVQGSPEDVALDAQRRLWFTDPVGGFLGWIDTRDGRRGQPLTLRESPSRLTVAGDQIWVTHTEADLVSVIDAATGQIRRTVHIGDGPQEIVASSEPSVGSQRPAQVWVTLVTSREVVRLDHETGRVQKRLPLSYVPQGLALAADGLWFTLAGT